MKKFGEILNENFNPKTQKGMYFKEYKNYKFFKGKIRCGFCGKALRILGNNKMYSKFLWTCYLDKNCIDSRRVSSENVELAFNRCLKKLMLISEYSNQEFVAELFKAQEYLNAINLIKKFQKDREKVLLKSSNAIDLYLEKKINEKDFYKLNTEIQAKLTKIQEDINVQEKIIDNYELIIEDVIQLKEKLVSLESDDVQKFNVDAFKSLVDYVIVGGKIENGRKNPFIIRFIYRNRSSMIDDNYKANIRDVMNHSIFNKENNTIPILDFKIHKNFSFYEKEKSGRMIKKHLQNYRVRFEIEK